MKGCEIVKRILKQHQLTKKHIDLMNKIVYNKNNINKYYYERVSFKLNEIKEFLQGSYKEQPEKYI